MTAQELNQSLKEIHYNMLLKLQEAQAMDEEEECLGEGCEEYDDEDEDDDEEDEEDDYEDEE